MIKLYGYWRSSCSWRVRIALHYKEIDFQYIPVHLVQDGGEQFFEAHVQRNAFAQVPVLEFHQEENIHHLSQSLPIMEFLEECFSAQHPSILPNDAFERAYVRQLSEMINSGIQPIQNLSVLKRITKLGSDKVSWGRHWIQDGLEKVERTISQREPFPFMFGNNPTIADFCLIPQLYNARRFQCNLENMPHLLRIEKRCATLSAFQKAHPDKQPDAQL
jgi:maleylpyruvate isomerase